MKRTSSLEKWIYLGVGMSLLVSAGATAVAWYRARTMPRGGVVIDLPIADEPGVLEEASVETLALPTFEQQMATGDEDVLGSLEEPALDEDGVVEAEES